MTATDNRIFVDAPLDVVWAETNKISDWADLFTEYDSVDVLEDGPPVVFRLTTKPDADGRQWSWVSERMPDEVTHTVRARRIETGPFDYMHLRWDYQPQGRGTVMRWRQEFAMKPSAPFDDDQMKRRLDATTAEQMRAVAGAVEERYRAANDARTGGLVDIHGDDHARRLLLLTCGARLARCVEVATDLEIADQLAGGPKTVERLARDVGVGHDPLNRVLRALATVGVFEEQDGGAYANTPMSLFLSEQHPYSLAPLVRHSGSAMVTRPWAHLEDMLRHGTPPARAAFGSDVWEFLAGHPDEAARFDATMGRLGSWELDRHVERIRPERFDEIVDVGGGRGTFLAALLASAPHATGVLIDSGRVRKEAEADLERHGLAERAEFREADAFTMDPLEVVPRRAVTLKAVLHNWPDDMAERALRTAGASIDASGRVFLVEQSLAPGNVFDHAKWLDLDMMAVFGGRERSRDDWEALLRRAGLVLLSTTPAGRWGVLECGIDGS